jgi:hypothetical protein
MEKISAEINKFVKFIEMLDECIYKLGKTLF